MVQREALKARIGADSKRLKHHFVYQKGVFLKIKNEGIGDDRKGYQRNGERDIKDSSQSWGKGKDL